MFAYEFGPMRLDVGQHSLTCNQETISLPPRLFQILLILVENEGRLVSQEAIRNRAWPDSFVEEAAVSKNVSTLRAALRGCLGDVEVIRTVPKRGYQLLLTVATITEPDPDEASSTLLAQPPTPTEALPATETRPPSPIDINAEVESPQRLRTGWVMSWSLAGAALVVLAVGLLTAPGWRFHARAPVPAPLAGLAVLPFRDLSSTADSGWIGIALEETLAHKLSRDHGLPTVSADQVATAEEDLGLAQARSLNAAELESLMKRLGVSSLLTGTYMVLGDQVRLDLVLHQGGKDLQEFSQTVEQQDLQATVERAGSQMRAALRLPAAQSGGELQFFSPGQVATHFYALGLQLGRTGDTPRLAREAFSKAVAADPQFAEAHEALATAWEKVGHDADSQAEAQLALATCGSLPETRRLSLQAAAYRQVGGMAKSLDALARLRQMDPDNQEYKLRMAYTLFSMNKYADAAVLLREMEADRTRPPNLHVLQLLSTVLTQQGDRTARYMYADKIMTLARAEGSKSAEARAHLYAGKGWMAAHDGVKAVAEFKQAEKLSNSIGDKTGIIDALTDETAAQMTFHMPGAIAVGQRAIDLAADIGNEGAVASECVNLGSESTNASQFREAISYFKRALAIAQETRDKMLLQAATDGLATAYLQAEDLPAAERTTALELRDARETGNANDVAPATLHQAEVATYRGRWTQAAAMYQNVAEDYRRLQNPPAASEALVEYAWMLLQQRDPAKASNILHTVDFGVLQENASLAKYAEAWVENDDGNSKGAETLVLKTLQNERVPRRNAIGMDVLMQIYLRQKDAAKASAVAERYAALSRSIPEDNEVRRAAVRAAAQAEMLTGDRSTVAIRQLPAIRREALQLGHAVEVAELERLLAATTPPQPGVSSEGMVASYSATLERKFTPGRPGTSFR